MDRAERRVDVRRLHVDRLARVDAFDGRTRRGDPAGGAGAARAVDALEPIDGLQERVLDRRRDALVVAGFYLVRDDADRAYVPGDDRSRAAPLVFDRAAELREPFAEDLLRVDARSHVGVDPGTERFDGPWFSQEAA